MLGIRKKLSTLFFAAIVMLLSVCFITGTVYAESNDNVYYQEGIEDVDGNAYSSNELSSIISHDESLVFTSDFSDVKLLEVNNKLALIGSKEQKASFLLLNSDYSIDVDYSLNIENTIAIDLIYSNEEYILLCVDDIKSYVVTISENKDAEVETFDTKYSCISQYQNALVFSNSNSYKIGAFEQVVLQNAIDVKYYDSKIYYLEVNAGELSLHIRDLSENTLESFDVSNADEAYLNVNNYGVFVVVENDVFSYTNGVEKVFETNSKLFFDDEVVSVNSSSITTYTSTFNKLSEVQLKNAFTILDVEIVNSTLFVLSNNNVYLISFDNRELKIADQLSFAAGSEIDYSTLATIDGVKLTCDDSNVDVDVAGEHKVIYSFESNGSTYYFFVNINITKLDGVSDKTLYKDTVTLTIENGTALLNGEEYVSGTPIAQEGEYTIQVSSLDGFELYNYTFAIIDLSQIEDGETYANELVLTIPEMENLVVTNKNAQDEVETLINGESNALISEGKNILTVSLNETTYTYEYYIFVLENENELSGGQYSYADSLTINYTESTSAVVKLNGIEIANGYNNFAYFGTYYLAVYNKNGDVIKDATFTIDTKVTVGNTSIVYTNGSVSSVNGKSATTFSITETTSAKITFEKQAKDVKLNGNNVYSGVTTFNAGSNTLKLTGLNGYTITIPFKINPTTNLIDGCTYTGAVLPAISGGVLKLNDANYVNGTLITTAGDYKLDIFSEANLSTPCKTIVFTIAPELLNVSSNSSLNPDVFTSGAIIASTNNEMYYALGDSYVDDSSSTLYASNTVISAKGAYVFRLYYATYATSDHANASYGYNSSNNTYYIDYYFEIAVELGLNIENGQEFFDNVTILFAGADEATLTYFNTANSITVQNGYILKTIGKYTIKVEQGGESKSATFTLSPRLNVENSRTYLSSDNITIVDNGYAFSEEELNVSLVAENGSSSSQITTYTNLSDIVGKKLSAGTYQLTITSNSSAYNKVVNFIVVSSSVLTRGKIYTNGTAFNFAMYGVSVNLIAPQTGMTSTIESQYVEGSEILTVGKHYVSFMFTINGVTTSTDYVLTNDLVFQSGVQYYTKSIDGDYEEASVTIGQSVAKDTYYILAGTDSAIYFYVKPVIKYSANEENLTRTEVNFASDESIYITIQDGYGVDYDLYSIDSASSAFTTKAIYKEVGNHTLKITIGDTSYNITFTVDTYFKEDGKKITDETSTTNRLVYLKEATFKTITPAKIELDALTQDVYDVEINTIGNHVLTIKGINNYTKKLYILIKEVVTFNSVQVQSTNDDTSITKTTYSYDNTTVDLKLYGTADSLKINGTSQTLSGKEFTSSHQSVGYYTIAIVGTGSYTATYYFTILDDLKINGLAPIDSYDSAITAVCENAQSIKLNIAKASGTTSSSTFVSGDTLNVVGSYSLVVNGVGSYVKTYTFKINNDVLYKNSTISTATSLPTSLTSTSAVELMFKNNDVTYVSIKRNSQSITSFEKLQTIGQYNYVLEDANGNLINRGVTIAESLLFNGKAAQSYKYSTNEKVTIVNTDNTVSFASITLNGAATLLEDLENIAVLGNNKLVIKTVDGNATYTKTYTITIAETVTGSNIYKTKDLAKANAYSEDSAPSYIFNNAEFTYKKLSLDGSATTYNKEIITKYGLHEIVVEGVNDYEVTYYTFINLNTSLINNKEYLFNSNDLAFTSNAISTTLDENSQSVDSIGVHEVTFVGQSNEKTTYTITVKETISLASGEYGTAISPKVNGVFEEVSVDKYPQFENGISSLNIVGTYVLTVYGSNNYESSYTYTLKDSLTYTSRGVLDSTIVTPGHNIIDTSAITLNHVASTLSYAKYKLNDHVVSGLPEIELVGTNKLVVTDINGESETYLFILGSGVHYSDSAVSDQVLTPNMVVESYSEVSVDQITTNIYYTSYTLNGTSHDVSGLLKVSIKTIGNNELVIYDVEGNSDKYTIVIKETSNSTFAIYTASADAKTNAYEDSDNAYASFGSDLVYSMLLDYEEYVAGDAITTYGLHTINVLGVNGYKSTYYLFVNLNTNLIDGKTYYEAVSITANATIYAEKFEDGKISTIGNYTVIFQSPSSEEETQYTIKIRETSIGSTLYQYMATAKEHPYKDVDNAKASFGTDLKYTMTLNGEAYTIGTPITNYGYYELKVIGHNYESQGYYIFVDLNIEMEENYTQAITPYSNAKYYTYDAETLYVDDSEKITTPKAIKDIGEHFVMFFGYSFEDAFAPYKGFGFELNETSQGSTLYTEKAQARNNPYTYEDNAYASFGNKLNYSLLLDGEEYLAGTPITSYGLHKITLVGANEYTKDYYLFVDLYTTIENGAIYTSAVSIQSNAKITADYNNAFNGGNLNVLGNHKITFSSSVSLDQETYSIKIKETSSSSTLYLTPAKALEMAYGYLDNANASFGDDLVYTIKLDDSDYAKGSAIKQYGMHKVQVYGFNYESQPYYVFINLYTTLVNGKEYLYSDAALSTYKSNAQVTLDANSESLTQVGIHEVTFVGNSLDDVVYSESYVITTKEVSSASTIYETKELANANIYTYQEAPSVAFASANIKELLLDGNSYTQNDSIQGYGLHTIKLKGVNGYAKTYYIAIGLMTNIEDGKVYKYNSQELVNFTTNAKTYSLDAASNALNEIGNHYITFKGEDGETIVYSITVQEINTIASGVYNEPIKVEIKGLTQSTNYFMDSIEFTSNDVLDVVGKYNLTIEGVNNYVASYSYELSDEIVYTLNNSQGTIALQNGANIQAESALTITHTSQGLRYKTYALTGKSVSVLLININYVGNNVLTLTNVNDEMLTFTFDLSTKLVYEDNQVIELNSASLLKTQKSIRVYQASQDLRFVNYTLNGVENVLNSYALVDIEEIGLNILTFEDINGNEYTYNVQKVETYQGNTLYRDAQSARLNAYNYQDEVSGLFNTTAYLDGIVYAGEKIQAYGLHELVINGLNGYVSTYYVFINLDTTIADNANYVASVDIFANANIDVDGTVFTANTLNIIGNHTVKFTSTVSEDYEVFNIVLKEDIQGFVSGEHYQEKVTFNVNGQYASVTVNGEESIFEYSKVGHYDVQVFGANDYQSTIYSFDIENIILYTNANVLKGNLSSYQDDLTSVSLTLQNSGVEYDYYELNGNEIQALTTINTIGNNVLKVRDINGLETTYAIKILETSVGSTLYQDEASAKNNSYAYQDNAYASFGTDLVYGILVDGNEYEIGTPITTYGMHTINILGVNDYSATYYVYVDLYTNVEKNALYTYKLDISSNAVSYTIDGSVSDVTTLYEVGLHNIVFYSTNVDNESFEFTIKEVVNGISDGVEYINRTIVIESAYDRLVLNGQEYQSGSAITKIGNYTLEVYGANGYYNKYSFVNNHYTQLMPDAEFVGSVSIEITNAQLFIDGAPYESATKYSVVGKHTLTIKGEGAYEKTIDFVVIPNIKDVISVKNNRYVGVFALVDADGFAIKESDYLGVKIDNVSYTVGEGYTIVGYHTIKVLGTNLYEYTKDFVLEAYVPVEDGDVYSKKITLTALDADMSLDNKTITQDSVVSHGKHTLVIVGANGYKQTITFTYDNPNYQFAEIFGIIVVSTCVLAGVVLIISRRIKKKNARK